VVTRVSISRLLCQESFGDDLVSDGLTMEVRIIYVQ